DDESHPLLDPDAHNGQGTSHIQPPQAPADRQDKQHQSQHIQSNGGPYPGTQGMMAVQPEIKIFRRGDVEVSGIELFEQFIEQQKHIDQHRDLNNGSKGEQGPICDAIVGDTANDLQSQDDQGRARGKGGGDEARADNRGIPKRPAAQSDIKEGGDRVDGYRPDNGNE